MQRNAYKPLRFGLDFDAAMFRPDGSRLLVQTRYRDPEWLSFDATRARKWPRLLMPQPGVFLFSLRPAGAIEFWPAERGDRIDVVFCDARMTAARKTECACLRRP
jgi:hypothetical protein